MNHKEQGSGSNQNISEVLELLKQSYSSSEEDENKSGIMPEESIQEDLSESELQKKLKLHFFTDEASDNSAEAVDDGYAIDEDFLKEAEAADALNTEHTDEKALEEADELPWEDDGEKQVDLIEIDDALEVSEDDGEAQYVDGTEESMAVGEKEEYSEEEFLTDISEDSFEESEEVAEYQNEPIVLREMSADEQDAYDFEKEIEYGEDGQLDDVSEDIAEEYETEDDPQEEAFAQDADILGNIESFEVEEENDLVLNFGLDDKREPYSASLMLEDREKSPDEYELADADENVPEQALEDVENVPEEQSEPQEEMITEFGLDDLPDGFLTNVSENGALRDDPAVSETTQTAINSAELSLLLQFGCDDEILKGISKEQIEKLSEQEFEESIPEEIESDEIDNGDKRKNITEREQKVLAYAEKYRHRKGAIGLRFLATAVLSFLLLIYELLPSCGIALPGLLDHNEFPIPYILIGAQLMLVCVLVSIKPIIDVCKRIFSGTPNAYSVALVLLAQTVIYDIAAMILIATQAIAESESVFTFHLLTSLAFALAIAAEYATLENERRSFEFFFADELVGAEEDSKFTVYKSAGFDAAAEKMYSGGLDSKKNVYSPKSIKSANGYFKAAQKKSKKASTVFSVLVPSIILSVILGFAAIMFYEERIWALFAVSTVSLFVTAPVCVAISAWMPFACMVRSFEDNGYAYASEGNMEENSDCNVLIFGDLHLFSKCSPKDVNMAFYDSTPKNALLDCLDAIYSKIGGPLSSTFSRCKEDQGERECRINRIAKSGVEAVIDKKYVVLLGTEQFMARYGISFPNVVMNNSGDEIFTLCVSINGRASARIAVRYRTNELFEMLVERLAEDGIYCAIETFDPMINTKMLSSVRRYGSEPISIVHMNAKDYEAKMYKNEENVLLEMSNEATGVMARGSRLNLAVAMSDAKKMKRLRKLLNRIAISCCGVGAVVALCSAFAGWLGFLNQFIILALWLIFAGVICISTYYLLPKRERFSLEAFIEEYSQEQSEEQ